MLFGKLSIGNVLNSTPNGESFGCCRGFLIIPLGKELSFYCQGPGWLGLHLGVHRHRPLNPPSGVDLWFRPRLHPSQFNTARLITMASISCGIRLERITKKAQKLCWFCRVSNFIGKMISTHLMTKLELKSSVRSWMRLYLPSDRIQRNDPTI